MPDKPRGLLDGAGDNTAVGRESILGAFSGQVVLKRVAARPTARA